MQKGIKNFPIHPKTEYVETNLNILGMVKAVHIHTEYDKAHKCHWCQLVYIQQGKKKLSAKCFIPDITDSRFITIQKTK